MQNGLAMFNHHPEPAMDFRIEVDDLVAEVYHWENKTPGDIGSATLLRRFNKALSFRFVPGGECQEAMNALRTLGDSIEKPLLAAVN